ncbi:coiled-coil domain-containing protein 18-like [Anopheles marshallii]|uniref:coiled-coil domain-containing protein 18-like n=1 Tax=Anopheles marshallii TaxID=1521116 RepID=UPI00237AFABF|nr:coiled-coil domain-containing protein 18-like [Anopheles marshallii]
MTSQPNHDESDIKKQISDCEMGEPNGARPSQTWHHMLLYPSPSSSQLSYVSEIQTDVGSQPSTPLQQPLRHATFGEMDESATNYDSGNFSLSDSGGKEKLTTAGANTGHGDMHQRFVQLNTELYQTKTELLTYKYKWNEIRNEIELGLSNKIDKLLDEKNEVEKELEDVRKELARLKAQPMDQNGRELLRIRSELDGVKLQLTCKEQANESLKQTIVDQHVEKENLAIKIKALEHQLFDGRSEICGVKSTERWYRDELHRCQNENAKLKESYGSLEKLLYRERIEKGTLVETARKETLRLQYELEGLQQEVSRANHQRSGAMQEIETKQLTEELTTNNNTLVNRVPDLLEKNELLEQQNEELHAVLCQLRDSLQTQRQQFETLCKKEKEALKDIVSLREHHESDKSRIETLTAQLARECFTKRQIDVSVEKLKAQLKVLSINFTSRDYHRADAKECDSLRQRNHDLQEQCNRLINEQQQLRAALNMCTEKTNLKQDEMLLMENFRCIQSKNLNLELKLGQCVSVGGDGIDGTGRGIPSIDMVKRSEQTIRTLKQDVQELQRTLFPPHAEHEKQTNEKRQKSSCPKHGSKCWENVSYSERTNEEEDVEIRNLRIMLKAIESENRRRMKRYELNNRTLLKKVKEHARDRKQAEQRVEELRKEHAKCATLRCEMSSARERCLLMEADVESYKQEAATLRSEKDRLIDLLENNCLLTNDGDIWGSLKRAFKELHELKRARKENVRLHDELQRDAAKIVQLEASIAEWKLAADALTAEADDVRFELTEKALQLEESQRALLKLTGENSSLEQTVSMAGLNETHLTEKLHDLKQLVQVQEIRLETANERLKLYEQSEAMIVAAKDTFLTDLQSLQDAILLEKQEKYELEEEVRELRQTMVNAVGNSLQNFHPRDISAEGSGHLSAAVLSPEGQSLSLSCTSLDIDQLRALVEQSSQTRCSLQPLHECVSSLKLEMDNLNSVLQLANHHPQQPAHQQLHQRFPLSLMDELNDATNGRYGSR